MHWEHSFLFWCRAVYTIFLTAIGVNVIDRNWLKKLAGSELIWHLLFHSAQYKLSKIKLSVTFHQTSWLSGKTLMEGLLNKYGLNCKQTNCCIQLIKYSGVI